MKSGIPGGFWTAALSVGGLATVALFVLWSLYHQILDKLGFSHLGETNTMVFLVFMTTAIFVIAVIAMYIWYLNNKNASRNGPDAAPGENGVNFEIPLGWTFKDGAEGLAKAAESAVEFKGFTKPELQSKLQNGRLTGKNTQEVLAMLGNRTQKPVRPYQVDKNSGTYRLVVRGPA